MTERGAPVKKGLDYFPKMVNFYDDEKVFDLMEQFGPLGATVYDVILTIVYSQGYYAEMPKDKLARMIVRKIGSRWIKKEAAVQVIDACADIGLLHDVLLRQGIITSVGIQKRYYRVGVKLMRRRLYDERFWLLDETGEPLLNAPKNRFIAEEKGIPSAINRISSERMPIKGKETKRKENKESEREKAPARRAFGRYGNVQLSDAEYAALANDFGRQKAENYIGRLGAHMASTGRTFGSHEGTIRLWILQDEEKERKQEERRRKRQEGQAANRFHNFDPVGYDYDVIVKELNQGEQRGKTDGMEESKGRGKDK